MEIHSSIDGSSVIDSKYLAWIGSLFNTPSPITEEDIKSIEKVDTILLQSLQTFACSGHRYLYFEDSEDLSLDKINDTLQRIVAIKDPKGEPCVPKDDNYGNSEYGVSPDNDPFHDGYIYLWYCGQEKAK